MQKKKRKKKLRNPPLQRRLILKEAKKNGELKNTENTNNKLMTEDELTSFISTM